MPKPIKPFNYKVAIDRLKTNRVKRQRRKHMIHNELWLKRKKEKAAIEEKIAKLQLPKIAQEIIRTYNVPASPRGKILLRQELRAGFLKNSERKNAKTGLRLKLKEKIALKLAKNSSVVYTTLWKYRHKDIPIKEAYEMYRAAAEIMKKTSIEVKDNKELKSGFDLEGRNLDRTAKELKVDVDRKTIGTVNPGSRKELGQIAEVGENLVDYLYDDLPEFSKVAFEIIDMVVMKAFGEGQ